TASSEAAALFRKTMRAAVLLCVPIALVLSAGAPVIVPLLYGHDYDRTIGLLAIVAWSIPLAALGVPYTGVLIAREQQGELMRNRLIGVGFNIAATCIAVPVAGVHGAAVIRVATGAVVLALNYRSSVQRSLAPSFAMVVGRVPSG